MKNLRDSPTRQLVSSLAIFGASFIGAVVFLARRS
jgi:hypothetical protein